MWVEFVIGSFPCSKGLFPGSSVFIPPQKPTHQNSNLIRNQWTNSHSVEVPLQIPIYPILFRMLFDTATRGCVLMTLDKIYKLKKYILILIARSALKCVLNGAIMRVIYESQALKSFFAASSVMFSTNLCINHGCFFF